MRLKQVMEVTPVASRKIKELLLANDKEYLKIGVKTRGCSGMMYTMNYMDKSERKKLDELVETEDGAKIVVDTNALMSIIGTRMDYVSDRLKSEFTFENPNAKSSCGCGESFRCECVYSSAGTSTPIAFAIAPSTVLLSPVY